MNAALRMLTEYRALHTVLNRGDMLLLTKAFAAHAPELLRTRKLTAVDAAMSRNITVQFGNSQIALPLADIDRVLAAQHDNPTFGNVREMYARNCYLRFFRWSRPVRAVLDLGANRGMFSLLTLVALGADIAVGVEPTAIYEPVFRLLLEANHCAPERAPRYRKFVTSPSVERRDPEHNVSIQTILEEQKIGRFDLVKMDIEGHEREVFRESDWLANVENLCMEMHHDAGDLAFIPAALERYGFEAIATDQHGKRADFRGATFLYASCTGELSG
jgi:hypothetical protein